MVELMGLQTTARDSLRKLGYKKSPSATATGAVCRTNKVAPVILTICSVCTVRSLIARPADRGPEAARLFVDKR